MRLTHLFPLVLLLACDDKTQPPGDDSLGGDSAPGDSAGESAVDEDGDGVPAGEDCDDTNAAVNPSAPELCDGLDNDCDGTADEDATDASAWYTDGDGDGAGAGDPTLACEAPTGAVASSDDCNDADARFYPGAAESDCTDPNDYNCDGSVGYADADGDGFAACAECDDANAGIFPNATELCDGVDNDCDSLTDEEVTTTWWQDSDGDGFGDVDFPTEACTLPEGYAANAEDCDDADDDTWPGAAEICDSEDDDCDSAVDEGVLLTWYADSDSDTYGDAASSTQACTPPAGYTADATDCDDGDADTWPGAREICDSEDDDCDSAVDEGVLLTWYADGDGDGFGVGSSTTEACTAPSGYAAASTDCDDTSAAVYPGASPGCDGGDYDCDGLVDNDADLDTYPDLACGGTDCDDTDSGVVPEADGSCALGGDCLELLAAGYTSSGTYTIDPDGYATGLGPFDVSCDMSTDGGGWTLVLHLSKMSGLNENEFIALYGHNRFTDEVWHYDRSAQDVLDGLDSAGLVAGSSQGALGVDAMSGRWDDLRMACSASDDTLTESYYAQVDSYASTNGSWALLGAAANGTAYTVSSSKNSSGLSKIWHDNETTAHNSNHYLCDIYNTTYTSGGGAPQFGFCYTDHLNNPNTLDYGDSIVSLAFGTVQGSDSWSTGFTMECGNMGLNALQNTGTVSIWVR